MIFDIDAPGPGGSVRLKAKRDAMADILRVAFTDEAIMSDAETDICLRPHDLDRRLAFDAQINALDRAGDRRAEQLIDEDRAARLAMLD